MGRRDGSWDLETSWSSQQRSEGREVSVAAAAESMPRSKVVWLETGSTTFPCNVWSWSPALYGNTSRKDSSVKKVPDEFLLPLGKKVGMRGKPP